MYRPEEMPAGDPGSDQGQAHQRRLRQAYSTRTLLLHQSAEGHTLFFLGEMAPIPMLQRQFGPAMHDLQWLLQPVPMERSPQDRVPVHQILPRTLESGSIQIPF